MKSEILSEIIGKLSELGIPTESGNGADISISAEFIDAKWGTGNKKISYEAQISLSERDNSIYMYEKTTEKGGGVSFGTESSGSFQSGATLFRKVKSTGYAPDGKAYEYSLDLGEIPKIVKEAAGRHGWKFKTVLSKAKAAGRKADAQDKDAHQEAEREREPETRGSETARNGGYCTNCGSPLAEGVNFCESCGAAVKGAAGKAEAEPKTQPQARPRGQWQDHSNRKKAFFAKDGADPEQGRTNRASKFRNLVFWGMWAVLAVLCLLMLLFEFSALRLAGFALALAFPLYFRKKFYSKLPQSVFAWLVPVIIFVAVVAFTGSAKKEDAKLAVQSQGGVSVTMLEGVMPEKSRISVLRDSNPPAPGSVNAKLEAYDISLPEGSAMEGVAEIAMPYDKSMIPSGMKPEEVISAAYYNPTAKSWESVPYIINPGKGTVTVLTDHFSKYAVVYFKDGRKKLSDRIPEADGAPLSYYTGAELEKFVSDMAGGSGSSSALNAGWSKFNEYYGLSGAAGNILGAAVEAKTVSNVNSLLTEAGAGFALAQLAIDMYNGDNKAACNNFVKNAANYAASKWGGAAVGLASAGVTFIDISLNKFAETALDKNLQKWEDTYREYYNTKAKRTAVDWYKIVKKIYSEANGPDQFKAKLEAEMDKYCDLFWKDVTDGYTKVSDKTALGVGGEYALGVSKINANYKNYLYSTTMKPVMAKLMQYISYQEYKKASANFEKLKAEMNREYTITVNLANYSQAGNLKATMVRFRSPGGQVAHSQSFDDSGRAVVKMSLFGFLKAGGPTTVEVKVPAQENTEEFTTTLTYTLNSTNIVLNVPYVPKVKQPEKPAETARPYETPRPAETAKPSSPPPATSQPAKTEAPVKTTTVPREYNYGAALSAWAADFAAEVNKRVYDDGRCRSTFKFEWVVAPYIKNGQVYGASRIIETDVYYDGPRKGETVTFVSNEAYDASNHGVYIYADDLRRKYPQFG